MRPAPGVQLTIRLLPSGGGGLRIGLMIGIAVLAIAAMVAAPYLAPVLVAGATTTGALGVALGAGAAALVSIGGTLLLNHFLPPPVPEVSKNQGNDPQTYLVQGRATAPTSGARCRSSAAGPGSCRPTRRCPIAR